MIDAASTAATRPYNPPRRSHGPVAAMSDLRFFLTAYAGGLAFFLALLG